MVSEPYISNDQGEPGAVFVYYGSPAGLHDAPVWKVWGHAAISSAGDVNGDGYSDVIIGDNGHVHVYYGSSSGLSKAYGWTAVGSQENSGFGDSVSAAGDVNGDGYGDVIVSAPFYAEDKENEGRVFIYYGSSRGLSASEDWSEMTYQEKGEFGRSVRGVGDVNGDGYGDVMVTAPGEGRVYLFYGSAGGPRSYSFDWIVQINSSSINAAGDVNGDGFSDVIVGDIDYSNGQAGEGRAFLYYGNNSKGLAVRPRQVRANGVTPVALLGSSDRRDAITLCLDGRASQGRVKARLEWEVAPRGKLFTSSSGVIRGMSTQWRVANGQPLCETIGGLMENTPYHWRVRLRYLPTSAPTQPAGRWVTIPAGGWNEARLRTAGPLLRLYLPAVMR